MTTSQGDRTRRFFPRLTAAAAIGLMIAAGGCASQKTTTRPLARPTAATPDYGRPLPDGASALRLIRDPSQLPDVSEAYRERDALLRDAVDRSLAWFDAPSSRQFFPFEGISHEQARASLVAMRDLLERSPDAAAFRRDFTRLFDTYRSVGYDGQGVVLFTGYFSPIIPASTVRTSRYRVPLYRRPPDLVTDPITGEPRGRRTADGRIVPYYTRAELGQSRHLEGGELFWVEDELSAYIVHINGSAKLRMPDGSAVYIGYAGKTDRPYTGLGRSLIDEGVLGPNELSLIAIRRRYTTDPALINRLILRNENYVFFTEYDGGRWPAGSLGVRVTAESSLATDKKVYPRGGLVLVDTNMATFSRGSQRFLRFMLDQDTGGAIKAPGRADIFMGVGSGAEILAGGQYAEGNLYYFFLKPEYVADYVRPHSELALGGR